MGSEMCIRDRIRFGSRADVYYENYEPLVKIGQTAISGETLLAKK